MCRPPRAEFRSPSDLRVTVLDSLDGAAAACWEALAGETELYASVPWQNVERRLAPDGPFYLAGHGSAGMVAGLTAHPFDRTTPAWPFARIDAMLRRLLRDAGHEHDAAEELESTLPTLLLGGRRPGHTRLLVAPWLDTAARREAAATMLQAAEALSRRCGAASLSCLYVDEGERLFRSALRAAGYAEFPSAIASWIDVPSSFDEWLEQFPSRKRHVIQRERRRIAEAGITYDVLPLSPALVTQILPLELGLYDKYGSRFPPEEARRLHTAVIEELGEDAQALVAMHEGIIRGFVVVLRRGDVLYARQGGFDYAFQGRLPLYFGLGFYAMVEHACNMGARRIEYGIGSHEAKASRGAARRKQYGYLKVLNGTNHAAVARLLSCLSPREGV